jgi:Family of unknown function (DUF5681)
MMQFQKGQSGNPAGKPKGCRNKLTILLENVQIQEGALAEILEVATGLAKKGNVGAMRIVMSYIFQARREVPGRIDLPSLNSPDDVLAAMQKVASGVAEGELTASEGAEFAKVFQLFLQALGYLDLERRVRALQSLGRADPSLPKPN